MIKSIVFDFDGVILNTNHIKREAYYDIFPKNYKIKKIIDKVLKKSGKLSRKIIISNIIDELKKKDLLNKYDVNFYINKYGKETQRKVLATDEIKGAMNSLRKLSKNYILFVNTSAPGKSIEDVIKKRNLKKYFKEVFHSDKGSKIENMENLILKYKIKKDEIIFVGDGNLDLECAKKLNIIFIGIINDENDFKNDKTIKYKLNNCENLVNVVEKIDKKNLERE